MTVRNTKNIRKKVHKLNLFNSVAFSFANQTLTKMKYATRYWTAILFLLKLV